MGLACSKAIALALDGDISVKHSQRNLTIFSFTLPVKVSSIPEYEILVPKYKFLSLRKVKLSEFEHKTLLKEFLVANNMYSIHILSFKGYNTNIIGLISEV